MSVANQNFVFIHIGITLRFLKIFLHALKTKYVLTVQFFHEDNVFNLLVCY